MKLIIDNMSKASTYSIQACLPTYSCSTSSLHTPRHISTLCSYALKNAKEGNFNKDTLNHARNTICKTIGWSDLVDFLFVHAYIIRNQYKALLEQKWRSEERGEGPSKRFNKEEKGRPQTNFQHVGLHDEVLSTRASTSIKNTENDCLKHKNKGPTYKLESDIKTTIDLKKVLKDHILNEKVELL